MTAPSHAATGSGSHTSVARRVAAWSLAAWGLVHVVGGVALVGAASTDAATALSAFATGLASVGVTGNAAAITGIVGYHGFNIAAAGVAVGVGGWRARTGSTGRLSMPMVVATVADLGLVVFLVVPDVMAPVDATPGILLLVLAAVAAWRSGWRPGQLTTAPHDRGPRP